jgi:hypothetical protein
VMKCKEDLKKIAPYCVFRKRSIVAGAVLYDTSEISPTAVLKIEGRWHGRHRCN